MTKNKFKEEDLLAIAKFYHKRCDEYDSAICTGKDEEGAPIPVTRLEKQKCSAKHPIVLEYCVRIGGLNGYERDEIIEAIQGYRGIKNDRK